MRKNIKAVIPIRAGSQRVKNKNLRNFNKKNLLIHKIEKLKKVDGLSGIIVNTDSDEAIEIAKKYKVNFWKRDGYFASSKCLNSDFWQHIADTTDSDHIYVYQLYESPSKVRDLQFNYRKIQFYGKYLRQLKYGK